MNAFNFIGPIADNAISTITDKLICMEMLNLSAAMPDPVQILGYLAALASVASFLPQAWKIVKTRNVDGLSVRMYALTTLSFCLWLLFGILNAQWPLILPNALCLVAASFILVMLLMPKQDMKRVAEKIDRAHRH